MKKFFFNDENQSNKIQINNTESNQIINNQNQKGVFLFNNPNIFDSFLIMLNHIIYINYYLMNFEDKIKNFIKSCENNEFCLTGYLYYINKYLWTQNPEEKKSKTELIFMYKSFL